MRTISESGAPDALLTVGATAYLKNVRAEMSRLLARTDDSLRAQLGQVYAAAEYLRDDEDQWQSFCEQDEWLTFKGRPRVTPSHRGNAIKHAIRFAVGFEGAKANSTVHRYNSALKTWWQEGVPAKEIPNLLRERGGIEKMKRENAGGLLLKLRDNKIVNSISKEPRQFDAILVVRFSECADGPRDAQILTGFAAVGNQLKLGDFKPRFKKWRDREEAAAKRSQKTTVTTL